VADESHFTIELALQEALANAIVHGNHEDPHKRVYVKCRCTTAGEVSITVQDEGHGFERDAAQDPTSPDNGPRIHLVGNLIRALMDEVEFEEGGSAVRMCKRGSTSSAASLPRVPHSAEGAL